MSIARKIADRLDTSGALRSYSNVDAVTGNAVDIFIYDTSKDSDGGAWRKRTQATSWYNEAASTTRGSRKDFPAVAVIVLEYDSKITIYDGDTPDLDMWMVFSARNASGGSDQTTTYDYYASGPYESKTISAVNGILVNAQYRNAGHINGLVKGVTLFKMIEDASYMTTGEGEFKRNGNLGDTRNSVTNYSLVSAVNQLITNDNCNDVAMTVLPNAPIDSATGLPTPTIAVATDGGVSVIKDDGTIKSDGALGLNGIAREIYFQPNTSNIFFMVNNNHHFWADVNATTLNGQEISSNPDTAIPMYWPYWTGNDKAVHTSTDRVRVHSSGVTFYKDYNEYSPTTSSVLSSVAYMTSKYNTGYMTGDIRGAWNVDTDVTSLSGTELVTNGTFASDTGWTKGSGWTVSGGTAVATNVSSGIVISQTVTLPIAGEYIISVNVVTANSTYYFGINGGSTGSQSGTGVMQITTGYLSAGTRTLSIGAWSSGLTATFDDISVRLAIPDRSAKGNGLAVHGTPTVSAVATGAELKCISGFSTSNYLEQPYNSDLDFGTGEYSVSVWVKNASLGTGLEYLMARGTADADESLRIGFRTTGVYFDYGVGAPYSQTNQALSLNSWTHIVCMVSTSEAGHIYVNGVEQTYSVNGTAPSTFNNDTDYNTVVGVRWGLSDPFGGSMALLRISATAPTAEQIKEIYEAEKPLFQDNAKCTLNGTSDAVTAMDYDDSNEELLVGTSGGLSVFKGLRRVDENNNNITEVAQQGSLRVEEY